MNELEARPDTLRFFRERFGLDDRGLAAGLDAALERRVDYADLFFEVTTQDSVVLEEGIVKSGDRHLEQGVGVRAQAGERQGYAHADEVTVESVRLAAATARAISEQAQCAAARSRCAAALAARDLYPVACAPTDVPVGRKVELLGRDRRLRARPRPAREAGDGERRVAAPAGARAPPATARCAPTCGRSCASTCRSWPRDGARREVGYQGMGGRFELARAARSGGAGGRSSTRRCASRLLNLDAEPCPAGSIDVVLGPGWPGVLLHEAIGHGLEGDFNRKQTSAFAGRLGERVAAPGVTVVDDGTLPGRRGSLNVDDEGTPTQRTVLIEDGVLCGYLQDRLNARLMGMAPHRQRPPRELRAPADAAHDQHLHARRPGRSGGDPALGRARHLRGVRSRAVRSTSRAASSCSPRTRPTGSRTGASARRSRERR